MTSEGSAGGLDPTYAADSRFSATLGELVGSSSENPNPMTEAEVAEFTSPPAGTTGKRSRGRPKKTASSDPVLAHADPVSTCYSPFQNESATGSGFAVSDLVWGKVRSHPWWPGEVFDPEAASEMAQKKQKKGHLLVAYFGDKTFAWVDETALKPFTANFAHLSKQSKADAFMSALDDSMLEVVRRIELALSCSCVNVDGLQTRNFENAGLKEGLSCCQNGNAEIIRQSFVPASSLGYIQELAEAPGDEADRLDIVVTEAHVRAFNRFRGFPDLPKLVFDSQWDEVEREESPEKDGSGEEAEDGNEEKTVSVLGKRRGRPRKTQQGAKDGGKENKDKHDASDNLQEDVQEFPEKDWSAKEDCDEWQLGSEHRKRRGRPKKSAHGSVENAGKHGDLDEVWEHNDPDDKDWSVKNDNDRRKSGSVLGKRRGRPRKALQSAKENVEKCTSLQGPEEDGECPAKKTCSTKEDGNGRMTGSMAGKHRGRPRKTVQEVKDGAEGNDLERKESEGVTDSDYSNLRKNMSRKKAVLSVDGDMTMESVGVNKYATVWECMQRSADQLSQSQLVVDCFESFGNNGFGDDFEIQITFEDYSSASEMLSQLCLAASSPMMDHGLPPVAISFFSRFRNSIASPLMDGKELLGLKVWPKRSTTSKASYRESSDYLPDTYWSDILISDSGTDGELAKTEGQCKEDNDEGSKAENLKEEMKEEWDNDKLVGNLKEANVTKESFSPATPPSENAVEKAAEVEECMPTALVLNFNDPNAVPSESELTNFFSRFGPLREAATEVQRKANRAQVVFKRISDAQKAFNSAERLTVLGRSLNSYHLQLMHTGS